MLILKNVTEFNGTRFLQDVTCVLRPDQIAYLLQLIATPTPSIQIGLETGDKLVCTDDFDEVVADLSLQLNQH